MTYLNLTEYPTEPRRGGGRIASPAYRQALTQCEDFTGLQDSVNRYDLLLLVKRAGKSAGFSPRMIQLLDYYLAFTRDCDWEEGSRPIVFQSLARTALDLGVTERQIQNLEQQLFQVGALAWNDSGNHRRFGQRDAQSGRLLFAFGVDLTPLAYLKGELEAKLQEKQLLDQAWLATKRQISSQRRQICALLLELQAQGGAVQPWEADYAAIAGPIRTYHSLADLRALLSRHQALQATLLALVVAEEGANEAKAITGSTSPGDAKNFVHYNFSTQESTKESRPPAQEGFQESVVEPAEEGGAASAIGLPYISLSQVLQVASDRFRAFLPCEPRALNWADVIEAAWRLRTELGISQTSWGEGCQALGRTGAAICVLFADLATQHEIRPAYRSAVYYRRQLTLALENPLHLQSQLRYALSNNSFMPARSKKAICGQIDRPVDVPSVYSERESVF